MLNANGANNYPQEAYWQEGYPNCYSAGQQWNSLPQGNAVPYPTAFNAPFQDNGYQQPFYALAPTNTIWPVPVYPAGPCYGNPAAQYQAPVQPISNQGSQPSYGTAQGNAITHESPAMQAPAANYQGQRCYSSLAQPNVPIPVPSQAPQPCNVLPEQSPAMQAPSPVYLEMLGKKVQEADIIFIDTCFLMDLNKPEFADNPFLPSIELLLRSFNKKITIIPNVHRELWGKASKEDRKAPDAKPAACNSLNTVSGWSCKGMTVASDEIFPQDLDADRCFIILMLKHAQSKNILLFTQDKELADAAYWAWNWHANQAKNLCVAHVKANGNLLVFSDQYSQSKTNKSDIAL